MSATKWLSRRANPVVDEAVAKVRELHPIEGYVGETAEEITGVCNHLLSTVSPSDGVRLLDIGCGALDKTGALQLLGFECYACDDFGDPWHRRDDNLERLLAFARDLGIHVHVQDATYSIPWDEGSFDVVTLVSVIEHLAESPREILNVAGRYLRAGGTLIVVTPNAVNLRKRIDVLRGRSNYPPFEAFYESIGMWRGHIREYTVRELTEAVRWSGFEPVVTTTFHGMTERKIPNSAVRGAYRLLTAPGKGLRDSLFVAARKPDGWSPRPPNPYAARSSIAGGVPDAVA